MTMELGRGSRDEMVRYKHNQRQHTCKMMVQDERSEERSEERVVTTRRSFGASVVGLHTPRREAVKEGCRSHQPHEGWCIIGFELVRCSFNSFSSYSFLIPTM